MSGRTTGVGSGPGSGPGYSGTPLARKLGINEGHDVALVGAPQVFRGTAGAGGAGGSVNSPTVCACERASAGAMT